MEDKILDTLASSPNYIGQFTKFSLNKLPRPQEGEIAYLLDSQEIVIYNSGEWKAITWEDSGLKLPLYDLNKDIISQLSDMTDDDIQNAINLIDEFDMHFKNKYYMLYGKEISYFTLFSFKEEYSDFEVLSEAVITCLKEIGTLKSISKSEDELAIEIWITIENNTTCLYLFPYDTGIVGIGV